MASILSKVDQYLSSSDGQDRVKKAIDAKMMTGSSGGSGGSSVHTIQEAADKFIEVLRKTIDSSSLSDYARRALYAADLDNTSPYKVKDGVYEVRVYFSDDLYRPSLVPNKYGGIDNIVALLNNGVDHTMNPVYGIWQGVTSQKIRSKTVIPGAHFIEQAVSDFMGNYGYDYNVTSIKIEGF